MRRVNDSFCAESSLTLVGVGPGDPSLLTLAAVEAIQNATVVSFPISKLGEKSLAAKIASNWITDEKRELPLVFPMVSEIQKRKDAWRKAGKQLAEIVANGEKVVFLCQGDISLYSTSAYLLLDIKSNYPECPLKLIPGINSFSAAAAKAQWTIGLQQEQVLVIPTPEKQETLEKLLKEAAPLGRVVVLLKMGKRWIWVRPLLEKMNLLENSLFAQEVGLSGEIVLPSTEVPATTAMYFSLLLIRQSWPEILP